MQQSADKGTTSIALVHEALAGARERGYDINGLLTQANIDPALLQAPNARISAKVFSRLWVVLSDLLDDEFFGSDSHPMRRGSFRMMCHAALGSDSLDQALRRALSFLRLVLDDIYGELRYEGEFALLIIHDHGIERRLFSYGTWLILVHGLLCWLGNRRLPIHSLQFRPARPVDDSDYRMRFCERIAFGAPQTVVRLERSLLEGEVLQTPATLNAFMRESPGSLLVKYRNSESMSARIGNCCATRAPSAGQSWAASPGRLACPIPHCNAGSRRRA
ncbi:AraC family transcriptional regulator [Pseudomonas sp. Marseille-Q5115]|uniref:AraC family transcriptional regulator n=1 Tax=Pseudomonas sp. Marseille-Q5115 TaxID=2866593 RepID=UPI001CE3CF14|nr:AraC family transcriptional regulator [Pseudomonas sp. Marseille-Q5115]